MEAFLGGWKRVSAENAEAAHRAMGIPEDQIEETEKGMANCTITISRSGDNYTNLVEYPGAPVEKEHFKLGMPFTAKDPEGNESTACFKFEDGKLIEKRAFPGMCEVTIVNTVTGNLMKAVTTVGSVTSTSVWKKC